MPKKCPSGTYNNGTGLWDKAQCVNCTPGNFCLDEGLSSPQGDCRAGYYCPLGSSVDNQVQCPIGFYCPTGKHHMQQIVLSLF